MPRQNAALLLRGVMILLVARVIAAPVALNPSGVTDPLRAGLILRVCTWPVQEARPAATKLTVGEWTPRPESDVDDDRLLPPNRWNILFAHSADLRGMSPCPKTDRLTC